MKVIANSLPKSGTHVLTRILDLLGMNENIYHFSGSMTRLRGSKINYLKNYFRTTLDPDKGYHLDLDENRYIKEKYFLKYLKNFPEDTYSKAHLPYSMKLEKKLENFEIKMLYIIRDPRDVLISHFHHHDRDFKYDGYKLMKKLKTYKDKIKLSLYGFNINTNNPTLSLKDRINRSKGWFFSTSNNVCAIKFEEIIGIKGNSSEEKQILTLQKIERFLELKPNTLVDKKDEVFFQKAETFRKGKVNDWINYFDEELKDLVKEEIGDLLIELGYENDKNW